MKKFCLFLSLLTALNTTISIPVGATNTTVPTESFVSVSSKEFPDAYIITEYYDAEDILIESSTGNLPTNDRTSSMRLNDPTLVQALSEGKEKLVGLVTATAFVEQDYAKINKNGVEELVITSSRLLSKEEVDSIGIENFSSNNISESLNYSDYVTGSKEKLSLTFAVTEINYQNFDSAYVLTGTASWSGMNFLPYLNGDTYPAYGDDFLGFTWGGEFDYGNYGATATLDPVGETTISLFDAEPNTALVWSWLELQYYPQEIGWTYLDYASITTRLQKGALTGGGNTTAAVFEYIHTYEEIDSSVTISYDFNEKTGAFDIELDSVEDQWSLVCTIGSLVY